MDTDAYQRQQTGQFGKSAVVEPRKPFVFHKRAFLKDTNAEGNVYFARYTEWQGEAREDFLRQAVPDHMAVIQSGIKMITAHSWVKYENETFLFDEVLIEIRTVSLKKMSMELGFTYINKQTNKVLAIGGQKLAYADHGGKLIPVPVPIRKGAATCLVDPGNEIWHMQLIKKCQTERDLLEAI